MDTTDELQVDHEIILRQMLYSCTTFDELAEVASELLYFLENRKAVELEDLLADVTL